MDEYTIVGRIRKPHGIHGELVVEPLSDAPDAIFVSGHRVFLGTIDGELPEQAREGYEITRARDFKEGLLVTLRGVPDRNAVETWRGRYIFALSSELAPLGEGEVFLHELEGMLVRDTNGAELGPVEDVQEMPQGLMLDVRMPRGIVSIPFVDAIVTDVDRDARIITVDPPDGLLDL